MKNIFYLVLILSLSNLIAQVQTDIEWPTLAKSSWPMIKHDAQFTGRSPYKGPQTPTIVWTADTIADIFSGPVIGKMGNLYFGSSYPYIHSGHFYSLTPAGHSRWIYNFETKDEPSGGVLIDSSNTIYFGASDSNFYAFNPDGTLKWRYKSSASFGLSWPNIDLEGRLYIPNRSGELYSINPNGTLNWKIKYEGGFRSRSPAFSPDGNTIYIFGADSNLFALNLDSSLKWKFSFVGADNAPLIDSDGNIYFDSGYNLYCLLPNGSVKWIFNDFTMGSFSMPTIDKNGNIYAIAFQITQTRVDNLLISIDYNGNFRWKYTFDDEEGDDYWQPLICDSEGTVYVGSTFGNNYCAISSEGILKWKLPLSKGQVDHTGAIAEDGTLYIGVHESLSGIKLFAIRDTATTSVHDKRNVINYHLEQNYPNPFNPSTNITYAVKERGFVQLKVYDVLGKEVIKLVNEQKSRGNYTAKFNGGNLPNGVYIYSLKVNDFVQNKKMILLK